MSHLTELDRQRIEHGLRQGMSCHQLARELGKSRTTIAREILKHRQPSDKGASGRISNRCLYRRNCNVWHLCPGKRCKRTRREAAKSLRYLVSLGLIRFHRSLKNRSYIHVIQSSVPQ